MNKDQRKQLVEHVQNLDYTNGPLKVQHAAVLKAQGTYDAALAALEPLKDDLISARSDLGDAIEDTRSAIEEMKDEEQEKFDGMSEGLQQGSTGEAIEEAIEQLASAHTALEEVIEKLVATDLDEDNIEYLMDIDAIVETLQGI